MLRLQQLNSGFKIFVYNQMVNLNAVGFHDFSESSRPDVHGLIYDGYILKLFGWKIHCKITQTKWELKVPSDSVGVKIIFLFLVFE